MKIYVIGIGMDGAATLTHEAREAIDSAELLIGADRMLKPFAKSGKRTECCYKPEDIADILKSCKAETAAVLMSGDCGFFSGAKRLLPLLGGEEVRVIAGISSAAYFCAKLGLSYESMKFISLHGRAANIAVNVRMNEYCFFLLGGDMTAAELCGRLCVYGLSEVRVYIGEELGHENERVHSGRAADFTGLAAEKLSVLVTENPGFLRHIPSAIPDSGFERTDIPMTKAEVRCNAVASLDICRDSVCWDIGSGSGSVSVEMAFRCPDGSVYALDKRAEACGLTEKNARRFGCDNIITQCGTAPEFLSSAPAPDKVFIGGGSEGIPGIFACVYEKNPNADIAVTAVSLETLRSAADAFAEYGVQCSVTQLAVTRTRRVGSHTMLDALNPVYLIRGRLK